MTNSELEQITAESIQRHFDLEEIPPDSALLEGIRSLLITNLDYLLDHDFGKLLQILYRIDVSEEKARMVLSGKPDLKLAVALADLIIERQIEKARTRMEYGQRKNPDLQ